MWALALCHPSALGDVSGSWRSTFFQRWESSSNGLEGWKGSDRVVSKAFLSKNEEEFGDLYQARRCFFFVATKFAFEFLTKIWKIIMCLNWKSFLLKPCYWCFGQDQRSNGNLQHHRVGFLRWDSLFFCSCQRKTGWHLPEKFEEYR